MLRRLATQTIIYRRTRKWLPTGHAHVRMKTIPHSPLSSIPTMRKLAMGAWAHPKDPTVNVQLDIDITKTHEFLTNKPNIKLNALVIKIISSILNDYPDLNTTIIRKKLRQRQNNRIFIPTVFRYKKSIDLRQMVLKH